MLNAALFTLCLFAGLGYFLHQLSGRFNLLRAAQGKFTLDHLPERVSSLILIAIGQYKFLRSEAGIVNEKFSGWVHSLVFWGFCILGVQVVTMFGRAYSPDFPWLPAILWNPYQLVRDFFEVVVFVCVNILIFRWLVTQPKRLIGYAPAEEKQRSHAHWEAYLILALIGTITFSGLVYDGGRLVAHGVATGEWGDAMWEPFSFVMGRTLMAIGGPQLPIELIDVAWWAHNLAILIMLNFLPTAKHFHVITSLPNVFFKKMEPLGALSKMDLENAETFGTSHIDQFTWKQVLDMFSCTECGRCSSQCPATATGKPLAPRQLLLNLRDYLYEHQDEVIEKRIKHANGNGDGALPVGENIVGPIIEDEVLWSCNMCRACEESCPVVIEYVDKIADMRRHLVQEEARFPSELTRVFKGMETQSNPWGIGAEKRFDWAEGLDIPTLADKPDAEYLYYVGCAGAFDDRNKKTTQAFARILMKAGIDFACLANEEPCNGDSARRLGNEYLYQAMAQMCVETFNGYSVKKVITNCPHCFNTIKNELPQFEGHYEVIHAAELVRDLITKGRLQVPAEFDKRVAYHDSCYYGRFNDVYDEPRDVLTASGATLEEMKKHKHFGMCCGAGGGRMWIEEDADKRVNLMRTDQALETNPEVIAVSCPFCMTMLSDGIKAKDLEDRVETLDVMEIVDRVAR